MLFRSLPGGRPLRLRPTVRGRRHPPSGTYLPVRQPGPPPDLDRDAYAAAQAIDDWVARNVAKQLNVPFVDATKITHDIETGMGIEGSRKLHMWFMPGENPQVPKGKKAPTTISANHCSW